MRLVKAYGSGDWVPHSCLSLVHVGRKSLDVSGFYALIGVDADASDEEVKSAARQAIMRCHPDVGGDISEFLAVRDAYEVLCDSVKRAAYDAKVPERVAHVATSSDGDTPLPPTVFKPISEVFDSCDFHKVSVWRDYLYDAALALRVEMQILAGGAWSLDSYAEIDGIAVMPMGKEPSREKAIAFMLKKKIEIMQKGESK